jgi:hypothetical protein
MHFFSPGPESAVPTTICCISPNWQTNQKKNWYCPIQQLGRSGHGGHWAILIFSCHVITVNLYCFFLFKREVPDTIPLLKTQLQPVYDESVALGKQDRESRRMKEATARLLLFRVLLVTSVN